MSQSSLPPGRDFAVVPTLDSERESPYSYVAQWTTSGLSFSGHHITVDLPTGNLQVSTTDVSYPYYKAPFGVRRTLDIQEQQMHETGLRDYVNTDPRPHWFGNWSFGFESDVAETWKVTRSELMINTGMGLGGLFAAEDPDFRISSPVPMDTLLIYGVSRRMMEHVGWSSGAGGFLLRTRSGRFLIAAGNLQDNSLVDTLEGEVVIFDPVSSAACRLSTLMGYDHRSGEDRFVDRSMIVARWTDGLGHGVDLAPQGASPYSRYLLADGAGRQFSIIRDHPITYLEGDCPGGIATVRLVSKVVDESKNTANEYLYLYDSRGRLAEVHYPSSIGKRRIRYHYELESCPGALTAIENSAEDRIEFEYMEDSLDMDERLRPRLKIRKITDASGNHLYYRHEAGDCRVSVIVGSPGFGDRVEEFHYLRDRHDTKKRHITRQRTLLRRGYVLASGQLLPRTRATEEWVEQQIEYSDDGRYNVHRTIDPLGRTREFRYNEFNQVIEETDLNGRKTEYIYDLPAHPSVADPRRYDLLEERRQNLIRTADTSGPRTSFDEQVVWINKKYAYRRYGIKSSPHACDMHIQSTHRLESETDELGNRWEKEYSDGINHRPLEPTTVRSPSGAVLTRVFSNCGQVTRARDGEGNEHRYEYTARGSLSSYEGPNQDRVTLTYYDEFELLRSVTDQTGASTVFYRDVEGRLTRVIDPNGDTVDYRYDGNGRLGQVIRQRPAVTLAQGFATAAQTNLTTTFSYTPLGDLSSLTNAKGLAIQVRYDEAGRRTEWGFAGDAGSWTKFAYDAAGQLIAIGARDGGITLLGYYPGGEIARVWHPDWEIDGRTYDGKRVTYKEYDHLGRVLEVRDSEFGSRNVYAYDRAGNLVYLQDDQNQETVFEYNADGHLVSASDTSDLVTLQIQRDALGRVEGLQDSPAHDRSSQWRYLYQTSQGGVNRVLHLYQRVCSDLGWRSEFSYDPSGRMLTTQFLLPGGPVMRQGATYRPDGLASVFTGIAPNEFTYDSLKQLVKEAVGGRAADYDRAGNRLYWHSVAPAAAPASNLYSDTNQLVLHAETGDQYTHNGEGQLTTLVGSGEPVRFFWDGTRHLRLVRLEDVEIGYAYSYTGNLIKRVVQDASGILATVKFRYVLGRPVLIQNSAGPNLLLTWDADGALLRLRSSDPVSTGDWSHSLFAASDIGGNVLLLANNDGDSVAQVEYDPWGRRVQQDDPGGFLDFLGYGNGIREPLTGYSYFRTRWYAPAIGRWLSEDPLPDSVNDAESHAELSNLYTYSRNSPITFRDPSGLQTEPSGTTAVGSSTPDTESATQWFKELFKTGPTKYIDKMHSGEVPLSGTIGATVPGKELGPLGKGVKESTEGARYPAMASAIIGVGLLGFAEFAPYLLTTTAPVEATSFAQMEAHFLRHGSKGTVEMYLKLKPATNTGALVEIMRDTLLSVGKPWPFF